MPYHRRHEKAILLLCSSLLSKEPRSSFRNKLSSIGFYFFLLFMVLLSSCFIFSTVEKLAFTQSSFGDIPSNANNTNLLPQNPTYKVPKDDSLWENPKTDHLYRCIGQRHTNFKSMSNDRSIMDRRTEGGKKLYVTAFANGGLNQMRFGISDMVAIAKTMNRILILPSLDHTSFWGDRSEFKDIYNVEHFIEELKNDIEIVESLPSEYAEDEILTVNPSSYSKAGYYRDMASKMEKYRVINFAHTDLRLANNLKSASKQKLRCFVNFEALRYTPQIENFAKLLVDRLRGDNGERYLALHLRYEKDMLAFTGCNHDLTEEEASELYDMRKNIAHWKEKEIDSEKRRSEGKCPMSPRETALFLKAMGYPKSTRIYIAAGEIYGSNSMDAFTAEYPNTFNHSSLAKPEELQEFKNFQNRLAGVDHIIASQGDAFMYTHDGNMAKAVQGDRIYGGYKRTISPDRAKIVKLIDSLDRGSLTWENFASRIKHSHGDVRTGAFGLRPTKGDPKSIELNFYANPNPGCICSTISTD